MSEWIRFSDVSFGYTADRPVLQEINLTIAAGEFVALIGGNGSGKTTLAKHCNGLFKPLAGTVTILGRDTRQQTVAELSRIVAYCYQNPDHQIFQSTIGDEVAFGPKNMGLSPMEIEERVEEALTAVGIAHLRQEEPYFASKGTRQKIAVASVLAMRPQAIVLDEPTTGLDYRGVDEMMGLIRRLHQQGHTILMITHDMRLVAEHAERVIVMSRGRVAADGTPREVFAQAEVMAAAHVQPPTAWRFAATAGWTEPLPLTLAEWQSRMAKELKRSHHE